MKILSDAVTLHKNGQIELAEIAYKELLKLYKNNSDIYYLIGIVELQKENYEESIKYINKAIDLNGNKFHYHLNLGNAYRKFGPLDKSFISYDKAIKLNPNYAEAYFNRGLLYLEQHQIENSINDFNKVLKIDPTYWKAYVNLGFIFIQNNKIELAKNYFNEARKYENELNRVIGMIMLINSQLCDWTNIKEVNKLDCELTFEPLVYFLKFDNIEKNKKIAQKIILEKAHINTKLGTIQKKKSNQKFKIAYFSTDFNFHPVSIWLSEHIENHDKNKFELFAFCLKTINDPMRDRLNDSFDHWIDIDKITDIEVANLCRKLNIDIAIDLNGHTAGSRPGIFALRAAPIQVSHLGFPGTMGADYIDYLITDPHVVPEQSRQFFTEKIAYVPCGYTYDRQRKVSSEHLTRAQFGLPENAFVFTCQNGCQKINPEVFDIWMDILRTIPQSVLWLLEPHPTAVKNLRNEALARGVQSERLIFTKRETVSKDQEMNRISRYLASYKLADLFLDTWPYNAGTTAIDALWAGLPVLTKSGQSVVARMATSALHAIEMPELITTTPQEYRDLAVSLASNPQRLCEIKEKVERNRLTTALFDPVTNTKYIEAAYLEMYARQQEELKPAHIEINAKCIEKS